jgi:hypothetical protein
VLVKVGGPARCAGQGHRAGCRRRRPEGLDSAAMKKLLLLAIFGGLLALAAKKVRSV